MHAKERSAIAAAATYTRGERLADTVLHILGLSAAAVAMPVVIVLAALWHGDAPTVAATAVYGLSLLAMFAASAGYHLLPWPDWKHLLRRLDHAAIYVKIAGTYTPFAVLIGGPEAGWLLAGIWSAAGLGLGLKLFLPGRAEWLSLLLYLAMGWAVALVGWPILDKLTLAAFVLILVGGGLYTVGVVFHLWQSLPFQNAIWHAFVLVASFVFYTAILVELLR